MEGEDDAARARKAPQRRGDARQGQSLERRPIEPVAGRQATSDRGPAAAMTRKSSNPREATSLRVSPSAESSLASSRHLAPGPVKSGRLEPISTFPGTTTITS